jgi:hypothetical protein
VAPIEFTMRRDDYEALGGHMDHVMPLAEAIKGATGKQNDHILKGQRQVGQDQDNPWPTDADRYRWGKGEGSE